ncbi:MAG TPA: pantoate--beta-alanine ligase [Symbiobacteriaceae bacterium]|nr:pantoate--beta-alanine ligase [Symbiobacteriaceae bacterium]
MRLVTTVAELREAIRGARQAGKRIGFVPTMGYLHEGHRSLMVTARQETDFVVTSIFVNPMQFGPNEDLARYPRDLARDTELCASVPIDLLFHPTAAEVYPDRFQTKVTIGELAGGLCGASRPGHFDGVATVVTKLFGMVQPDVAFFGQKDAQQVAVIQRLVQDLNLPVEIRPVPTVREADGLALSSRNTYLSPAEREAALVLSRTLFWAEAQVKAGERDMGALQAAMIARIEAAPLARIDYVEIVDPLTLQPVTRLDESALAALAVRFGSTRLIDNLRLVP